MYWEAVTGYEETWQEVWRKLSKWGKRQSLTPGNIRSYARSKHHLKKLLGSTGNNLCIAKKKKIKSEYLLTQDLYSRKYDYDDIKGLNSLPA